METGHIFRTELVERCRANDRKAQLSLYNLYCDAMFSVAMRFLNNSDDAEDVLQESFIKAFKKLDQYKGEVSFGAWLKRIVVNRCIDQIRARKEQYLELKENLFIAVEDEDWNVEDGLRAGEVVSAMEKLPEKWKYVVKLYLVEGYDHGEISGILGITEANCRSRLLRGKAYLKELLQNRHYGTGS